MKAKFDQVQEQLETIQTKTFACDTEYFEVIDDAMNQQEKVQSAVTGLNKMIPYFDVDSTYNYLVLIKQQKKSRQEHCTPFEMETFLKHHVVARMPQPEQTNDKEYYQTIKLENLMSEIKALEKEMSMTSLDL